MLAIFKREFFSYFRSPVGYVAIALFSFLSGFLFINQFGAGGVNISSEIISLRSFFVIIIPIITMGLFAEDKKKGTDIIYYTSPISMSDAVIGKFLAALALFGIMFINVFLHMIITKIFGGVVDSGAWGSVIVFFFLAALFISLGLLASALTDSQIIAAIVSFVLIICIQLISTLSSVISSTVSTILSSAHFDLSTDTVANVTNKIENGINWLDPFSKTADFRYGIFSVAPLFFCLSGCVFFLFLTYRILEKKRWTQG